ncbi:MAG TPA: DUF2309 domain-containing protein [Turneriella sp.]|nr:DUF2309 domain-containing protein [Turneriella sp.]
MAKTNKQIRGKKGAQHKPAPDDHTVGAILAHLRHFLPSQGPIKDFIHHNTLHMFQDQGMGFHEAVRSASELYGSVEYLPLSAYRSMHAAGKITEAALAQVLSAAGDSAGLLREQMLTGRYPDVLKRPGFRTSGYLKSITVAAGIMLEEQVHPTVFRLVANYLDQGIAAISMAHHAQDFWSALRLQIRTARPFGLSQNTSAWILRYEPEDLIGYLLDKILPASADRQTFLLELLMAARGWSGLIAQVEENPAYLNYPRQITLAQYVALYIAILSDLAGQAGYKREELVAENRHSRYLATPVPAETEAERVARFWHEAMETSYYLETLAAIAENAPVKRSRSLAEGKAEFQALFCIDDRECSVRRYLEELSDTTETFGTPGFFGIDAVYQGPFDAISIKQCPVPVKPKHRIRGVAVSKRKVPLSRLEMNLWHRHANGLIAGWFVSLFFGVISLLRLVFSVHRPTRTFAMASSFAAHEDHTRLQYERAEGEAAKDGFFEGYTVNEMAERVGRVLRQIGLTHSFAPIVAVVGHGSSSTNNPYFAAYDCGACSGRPGLVNARAFALMANRADVRALLARAGIRIPEKTRFVGAIHDTARDEIALLDAELIGDEYSADLTKLRQLFTQALELNALERTRRFAILNFPESERAAVKEARLRTEMLFEPRPEYNHATNALAVVGRRSFTENIFLDRRAFFNSYDPAADRDGSILNGILTPLVPVCGGINLEYLFSRVDNSVFGAGSKLPHNVFSLVGVGNGSEGDLRTGLPEQMIEIHDPVRLLIVIEQRRELVERVLGQNEAVRQWVDLEWVHLVVFDLKTKKFYRRFAGEFKELNLGTLKPPVFADSRAAYYHRRDNITPAILHRKH